MSIWRSNPDLMDRLVYAQNSAALQHVDVMTFAGFFKTREELERHVVSCEERAGRKLERAQ